MSYEIGRAALNLEWTPRVARTEYVDNWEVVRRFTGRDPRHDGSAWREFYDAVHLDFLWNTDEGPVPWSARGRVTDMGHAAYLEDASDFRRSAPSPFLDAQDVLSFSAVAEYGLLPFDDLVAYYERRHQEARAAYDQVVTGGYYNTLLSGAIQAFGWERLLEAAGEDPARFGEDVLGAIFEQSLHHCRAWAQTSIEFFMCHDDMVWSQGPFLSPSFYRQYVFPRYAALWQPLKEAGKRVLFTSDGTFDMFAGDIVAAGADGLCFEPSNDLPELVARYGRTHALIGGADCRTLTFGTRESIEQELRGIFDLARDCPGFVFCTGNHFPANIPWEHARFYFDLIEELGRRT